MRLKIWSNTWALFVLALFGWFAMPSQSQAFFFRCGFGCGPVSGCGVQMGCAPCGGQVWAGSGVPVPVQSGTGYGRTTTVYPSGGGCLNGLCPAPVGGFVNPPRIPPQNIPEPAPKPKELTPKPKDLPKTEEEAVKQQIEDFYLSATPKPEQRTVTTLSKGDSLPLEIPKGKPSGVRMLLEWEGGVWPGDNKFYPKGSFKYIKEITPEEPQPIYQTQGFPYPSTGENRSWVRYPNQGNYPTILSPQMYRVGGCPNGNCPR